MKLAQPAPRRIGEPNWLGLWTLYLREVRRFVKVFSQTILAPVVTSLLFLSVFALALGGSARMLDQVAYPVFLVPGLVMMAIMQNGFANTSSSLLIAKIQGNIVDVLMPPLSASELTIGFAMGGVTRGLVVGLAVAIAMGVFVPIHLVSPALVLYHALSASLMMSLLGLIAGIWAEKFDQMGAITNFIVTPFAFLSGTFYSTERLTGLWHTLAHLNPFFYMIDGFRYGFIGHADASIPLGVAIMAGANLFLWILAQKMFAAGYRLKA